MKLSLFSTLLILFAGTAPAADADNLLPVEQATPQAFPLQVAVPVLWIWMLWTGVLLWRRRG